MFIKETYPINIYDRLSIIIEDDLIAIQVDFASFVWFKEDIRAFKKMNLFGLCLIGNFIYFYLLNNQYKL